MKRILACILYIFIFLSCEPEEEEPSNLSDRYASCNSQLSACVNGNGQYCLFGYKWGADNPIVRAGYNAEGPQSPSGLLSFSFQEENGTLNTHRQRNLASKSFNSIISCAKTEIRNALNAWEGVSQIEFEELADNSDSDLKFYLADIVQGGIGYPNYTDVLCSELSGNIVIDVNTNVSDCQNFFLFMLHEIGHVLGLGHVETVNVMNRNFLNLNLSGIQSGDSLGIIQIYGAN